MSDKIELGLSRHDRLPKTKVPIVITHIASQSVVKFQPFVTGFSDTWTSDYDTEDILGRMDKIPTYKSTHRKIQIEFEVVSASLKAAKENLKKISLLANMMYPVFLQNTNSIGSAPLIRVKYGNLIDTTSQRDGSGVGLLCACEGFKYQPDYEQTNYYDRSGNIYPKKVPISLSLTVIHEQDLGWKRDGKGAAAVTIANATYPYKIPLKKVEGTASNPAPTKTQVATRTEKSNAKKVLG